MGRYIMTWLIHFIRISKEQKQGVSRLVLLSGSFGDEFLAHSDCWQNPIPCIDRTEFLVSLLAINCELYYQIPEYSYVPWIMTH